MAEITRMPGILLLRHGNKADMPQLFEGEAAYADDTYEMFVNIGGENVNMNGNRWEIGTAMSGTSTSAEYYYNGCPLVKAGDMYLNTSNFNIYQCTKAGKGTAAKWQYKGCIKGANGTNGTNGAAGTDLQAVYSTTPKKIGTWIDGSIIYRAAWEFTNDDYEKGSIMDTVDIPNIPSIGSYKTLIRQNYVVTMNADNTVNAASWSELRTALDANQNNSYKTYCVIEYIGA